MLYLALALLHVGTRILGVKLTWVRQGGSYQGALTTEEVLRLLVEMILSHSIHAIDAVAHLDTVEIHLHDTLLAPHHLNEEGEIHLKSLASPGATRPKEDILGSLLTDGGGTMHLAATSIILGCTLDGIEVKSMMFQES